MNTEKPFTPSSTDLKNMVRSAEAKFDAVRRDRFLRAGRFKTAYSELYGTFVEIIRTHDDGDGGLVITARVPEKKDHHLFRPFELSEYCL